MVAAAGIRATQAVVLAAGAYPADGVRASQAVTEVATEAGMDVRVTQAVVLIAARGRVADPRVRSWTFSIDNHDFYVLRCGNQETLVRDLAPGGDWYVWGSGESPLWRAYTGGNWPGGRPIAGGYSDVVVGDDGNGSLYWLAPGEQDDDDAMFADTRRSFQRVITAQHVILSGYSSVPCYGLQLFGSAGQSPDDLSVDLHISDDRGISFESYGLRDVPAGEYDARISWTSLGAMKVPGRLFQIIDDGALLRVDGLDIDDGS